jgi:hypothetical protein
MICSYCDNTGLIEYCDPDGSRPIRWPCEHCDAYQEPNPREAGDDDGVEYSDPRDPYDDNWRPEAELW